MAKFKKVLFILLSAIVVFGALSTTACYHGTPVPEPETTIAAEPETNQDDIIEPESVEMSTEQQTETMPEPESYQQPAQEQPSTQPNVPVNSTATQPVPQQQVPGQQIPVQQQVPGQATGYEDVTVASGEGLAPEIWQADQSEQYVPAQVECAQSPNGYHSWTDYYEWYVDGEMTNTGSAPSAGYYTDSVYLYTECDYCGAKR